MPAPRRDLRIRLQPRDTSRPQPGVARDLAPFSALLSREAAASRPFRTDPRHLAPRGGEGIRQDRAAERAPNGNAVSLEEQALRIAETDGQHALAMGLHRKYLGLFRAALGRS
ncbi:hypothetical protein [Sabulicella rubraurantiaca]|uniref:hypothetical protein n=1 Tax=Sabulicella rubraurantiaca TaxID=2811429 RepID=UPI001A95D537|nr:hypothetical protein [Sabulicella rubraurantiaca]